MKNNNYSIALAVAAVMTVTTAYAHCGACGPKGAKKGGHDHGHKHDIVTTAVEAGSFKTLVAAVQAAGLADVLKGDGPFTVFAPTDEAFAKLPGGTLESLLKPENKEKLAGILKYHVVQGKVAAADVMKLKTARTVQGDNVDIKISGDSVMVDGATVVKTDISASNGIIHVINAVILPDAKS